MPQEPKVLKLLGDKEVQDFECKVHGSYQASRTFLMTDWGMWTTCVKCEEDKKRLAEEKAEARRIETEQRQKEYRFSSLTAMATIPLRFEQATLDNYIPSEQSRKIWEFCKKYTEAPQEILAKGISLILCGTAGTGKTHLACGIIRAFIPHLSCKYAEVIKLLREVKDTYNRKSDKTEGQIIAQYASYDLLVLDEVGVQFGSETEKMILFEVLNDRYTKMKPTILISNLAPAALSEVIGERVMDRMKDNGGKILVCEWQSNRK